MNSDSSNTNKDNNRDEKTIGRKRTNEEGLDHDYNQYELHSQYNTNNNININSNFINEFENSKNNTYTNSNNYNSERFNNLEFTKEILRKKDRNSNSNPNNAPKTTRNKSVRWDYKSLEEQEQERIKNPPKKKILEPKTPYLPFDENDDEYLKKLNEINKLKPTVRKNRKFI
jgi:hypothetical protein